MRMFTNCFRGRGGFGRAVPLLVLLAGCVPVAAPGPGPADLILQEVEARHTQEWVETWLTATAVVEQGVIATQVAVAHQTEMAAAMRQTEQAEVQQMTAQAATLQADAAIATATAQVGADQLTATAQAEGTQAVQEQALTAQAATATQGGMDATATVQYAGAATVATQEAVEQYQARLMRNVSAVVPWLFTCLFVAVAVILLWRHGVAGARQANVIRQADGDVYTMLIDAEAHEVRTVNPEKGLDPVIRLLPKAVESPQLTDPALQYHVTQNEQMIQLARAYTAEHRRIANPRTVAQLQQMFAGGQPEQLPAGMGNLLGAGDFGGHVPQGTQEGARGLMENRLADRVIHPFYGINPLSLPEIPLFNLRSRLIVGGSGSGKTNLTMYDIHRMQVDDLAVYDPKYRPGKWPQQAQVLVRPEELLDRLTQAFALFEARRASSQSHFPRSLTIVDEYSAMLELANLSDTPQVVRKATSLIWALAFMGREFAVNIWILSTTGNAASLGLGGRGDFRNSLDRIEFHWLPQTREEEAIPRIVEVSQGKAIAKYRVPVYALPAGSGDGHSGAVPIQAGSGVVLDGSLSGSNGRASGSGTGSEPGELVLNQVRERSTFASEYNDDELGQVWRDIQEGRSANEIQERIRHGRSSVLDVVRVIRGLGGEAA